MFTEPAHKNIRCVIYNGMRKCAMSLHSSIYRNEGGGGGGGGGLQELFLSDQSFQCTCTRTCIFTHLPQPRYFISHQVPCNTINYLLLKRKKHP